MYLNQPESIKFKLSTSAESVVTLLFGLILFFLIFFLRLQYLSHNFPFIGIILLPSL